MSVELIVAILGLAVAAVIGGWQIHLARKQVNAGGAAGVRTGPPAAEPSANGDNLLHRLWGRFDPELQDALSVAYNQAKREGKTRISTRTFFAAVARLRPGPLPQFLDRLPAGALPEPVGEDVPREGDILREEPLLSGCVEGSLRHLGPQAGPGRELSAAEVFVDVAKHGTGPSVARLREYGVTPERIDRLVGELGWEVRER